MKHMTQQTDAENGKNAKVLEIAKQKTSAAMAEPSSPPRTRRRPLQSNKTSHPRLSPHIPLLSPVKMDKIADHGPIKKRKVFEESSLDMNPEAFTEKPNHNHQTPTGLVNRNQAKEDGTSPSVHSSPLETPEKIHHIEAAEIVESGFVINIRTKIVDGRKQLTLEIQPDFVDIGDVSLEENGHYVISGQMKSDSFRIQSDKSCKLIYGDVDLDSQREEMVAQAKQELEEDTELFQGIRVPKSIYIPLMTNAIEHACEEQLERQRIQNDARIGYVPAKPSRRNISRSRSPRNRRTASPPAPRQSTQNVVASKNRPAIKPIVFPSPPSTLPQNPRARAVARRCKQVAPIAALPSNPPATRIRRARAAAAKATQAAAIPPAKPPRRLLKRIADDSRQVPLPKCTADEARFKYESVDDIRMVLDNIKKALMERNYGFAALDLMTRHTKLSRTVCSYDIAPSASKLDNLFKSTVFLCADIGLKAN